MPESPLAHLQRRGVPWRAADKTECGKRILDVAKTITLDDAKALIARHGQARAAFLLCMTCAQTASRYRDWDHSPSEVVGRESVSQFRLGRGGQPRSEHGQMDRELFAIAALIEAHRTEFDAFLAGLEDTVSLTDRRRAKGRGRA